MMDYAGLRQAIPKKEIKSKDMTWQDVYDAKPDVVVVASCGFDLERNRRDVQQYWSHFETLDKMGTRIYAADGNQYFARPGPKLSGGVAILALAAYEDDKALSAGIAALDFCPKRGQGWDRIHGVYKPEVPDVEDLGATFAQIHQEACDRGDSHYVDPASGYRVFTAVAHKKRGKCCGSGCRHCPFNHENVKDKAARIKQPAFLHRKADEGRPIKVLFFSGGKDSFLTIRALMREETSSEVVLFTTFDASSRVVANQDIPIKDIQRQAAHLDLSLIGVPLHRGSGIDYVARMREGTELIEKSYQRPIHSLVFGDLHLEHIRSWRERRLGELGYPTEYPIWHAPYEELLTDLERSQVPCIVSASTIDDVSVGTLFTREYSEMLTKNGKIDGFGECGEFHSLAKVWEVDRRTALGI
jgi:ATP-binding cassette subfamily B (MDR/TAP) protein 1